jgi:hypothetical protein
MVKSYDRLEPEIERAERSFDELEIQLSIAISLKRIADILQGKQQPIIMTTEEAKEYEIRFNCHPGLAVKP